MDSDSDIFLGISLSQEEKMSHEVFANDCTEFGTDLGLMNENLNIDLRQFVTDGEDIKPIGLELHNDGYQMDLFYSKPLLLQSATSKLPSTEAYPGPHDFALELPGLHSSAKSWIYSPLLHKIYINADKILPVRFTWKQDTVGLQVRALLVYMSPQFFQDPVERCQHHRSPLDKSNQALQDVTFVDHVVRSNHGGAIYHHDVASDRWSVVVPLDQPQPGDDSVTAMFTFQCKNSCASGMNRRATQLIFTLEDDRGNVLGRQKIQIRICSCPKRDKEKEEQDFKRPQEETTRASRPQEETTTRAKKRPSHQADDEVCKKANTKIVMVPVLGSDTLQSVVMVCLGALSKAKLEGHSTPQDNELEEEYLKLLSEN